MVACGHVDAPNDDFLYTFNTGDNGNQVLQALICPQAWDKTTPTGLVVVMNFYDGGKRIEIEHYSTVLDLYKKGNTDSILLQNLKTAPIVTTLETTTASTATPTTTTESNVTTTEPTSKGGCGSAVSLVSIALLPAFATASIACTNKNKKRK